MRRSLILEALFPEVRARVLAATFGQPDREWYVTELVKALDTQPSSLPRRSTIARWVHRSGRCSPNPADRPSRVRTPS